MTSEAPPFWWENADWRALLLTPFSALYGFAAKSGCSAPSRPRLTFRFCASAISPSAAAARRRLFWRWRKHAAEDGTEARHPDARLWRHRKGPASGGRRTRDSADHVGDEPLLMAFTAPVAVSRNRLKGAELLKRHGCDFIIMDDGFQSARLHADCNLLVVDARRGIGNGHVIPAGPLRAPLLAQMRKTDALLVIGQLRQGRARGARRRPRRQAGV